jgi:hypothetical protein
VPVILASCTRRIPELIVFARRVPVQQQETPTQPSAAPLWQASAQPMAEELAVEQWIKTNAIRLSTVQAGNGFADMEPLAKIVGNARIVALGEATHGTREFFQLKHRMVEFLATRMGFDDGHDLIGLGTSELASHEVIASAWGIFLNGYTPFLGAVLNPVVVLRSDVTQHLSTDGINLAIGPEEAYRPLFLLKGLDRRVEQDTIEATIHKTDVILMVFVEGVHGSSRGVRSLEHNLLDASLFYSAGISRAKPLSS